MSTTMSNEHYNEHNEHNEHYNEHNEHNEHYK